MHNQRNISFKSASADAEMSSTDFHSDDNLDSPVSQSRLLQRIESLDDILDRHEAIFGTGQSPGEAPSPTLQPTEPSETSWECIESFPSPRDSLTHESWVEPRQSRQPLHKEALLRLHSRAKYLASLPKRGGLPPPTFEPRSRPRTSVEDMRIGLPPPPVKAQPKSLQLQSCKIPVQPIRSAVPKQERTLVTMPKDLVGPTHGPTSRASEDFVTQKSIASMALKQVQVKWLQIIQSLGDCSILAHTTAQTAHEKDLIVAALKGYQASSLQTYLRQIENFLSYLEKSRISLEELTLPQFLDYLWACQDSQHEDRYASRCKPASALKALSWFYKKAQIESLRLVCLNPLALAFIKPDGPTDRNEAIPLPLAIVVAWEDKIREPSCPPALALLLGGFLLAVHSSLRFGDLQRICTSSLSIASDSLRGSCWTTKTSLTGQPFAVTHFGLSGRDTASAWTITWLSHVQDSLLKTRECLGVETEPDFLIPTPRIWDSPNVAVFNTPLQYHQALTLLRWLVQTPWRSPLLTANEASAFTLHSLKVSLLSASAQLRLPEESRRLQGHHKQSSVQLYSRDDTIQSLWLQRQIAIQIQQGWRPPRPQARGSQPHTIEPAFSVSAKPIQEQLQLNFVPPSVSLFLVHREASSQLELKAIKRTFQTKVDEEAILVEDFADSSSSEEEPQASCPSETQATVWTSEPSTTSFAVQIVPDGAIHAALQPSNGSEPSRTACGRDIPQTFKRVEDLLVSPLCRRSGCRQAFQILS